MRVQHGMRRLGFVPALVLVLLAAACSGDDGNGNGRTPTPTTTVLPTSTPSPFPSLPLTPTPTGGKLDVEVWLTKGNRLFPVTRTIPSTPTVGAASLVQMLLGPIGQEQDVGLGTRIQSGTGLNGLTIEDGLARADFSTSVESDPLSAAQVVYTLTQFPTVERVLINGAEGGPLTRDDLTNQLPPIVVISPAIGDHVTSPVTISGTADVFEATVSIRIIDQDDHVIAHTTTTASCGTGCRGDYSETLAYDVSETQPGFVMVFEESAENGLPIHVVKIPVVLTA